MDSLGASSGYGLLMDTLAELKNSGKSIEEVRDFAEERKLNVHHWFFSTDLTFYIKGGRVSKTSGMVGTLLGICPLLNMNTEGKLIPRQKVRTKRKVIAEIVKKMEEHANGGLDYTFVAPFFINSFFDLFGVICLWQFFCHKNHS